MSSTDSVMASLDKLTSAVVHYARLRGIRLTRDEVCARRGIHRNTLANRIAANQFPGPIRDGKWLLADILEWEAAAAGGVAEPTYLDVPTAPDGRGVHLYRHYDADGTLLYVGISQSALRRLADHSKVAHWYARIARVEIVQYADRQAAMRSERHAILTERPRFNIAHAVKVPT